MLEGDDDTGGEGTPGVQEQNDLLLREGTQRRRDHEDQPSRTGWCSLDCNIL